VAGGQHTGQTGGVEIVGAGTQTVPEGESVETAVAFGGGLEVLGHVKGDAVAFGGNVHLGPHAVVDGDVTCFGGTITREPGAKVGGGQTQMGGSGVWRSLGKHVHIVSGKHAPAAGPNVEVEEEHHHAESAAGRFVSFLLQFALFFALGFLFMMFAPARMKIIEGELWQDPVKCVLAGIVGAVALSLLALLLTVTIVGIPFALCLLLIAAVGIAMGFAAVAMEIGTRIPVLAGRKTQAAILALGVAVLLVVKLVPVVGPTLITLVAFFSLGAVIRTRLGTGVKPTPAAPA
jgi:hypothetical protein